MTELQPPQRTIQSLSRADRTNVDTTELGTNLEDGNFQIPAMVVDSESSLNAATAFKLVSSAFAFFVAGVNDGSLGALIPYIIRDFNVGTGAVTVIYATQFAGWVVVAIVGGFVSSNLGLGGALVVGASSQLIANFMRVWGEEFGLFTTAFFFSALGQAFQDSLANTFVSGVGRKAHRWLGVIHACYGFGCMAGPLVATGIAGGRERRWKDFYYFLMGLGILNLVLVGWSFRIDVKLFRHDTSAEVVRESQGVKQAWKTIQSTMKLRTTWLLSLFYFFYLGVAITAGGWLVEFLVTVRKGQLSKVGYVATGFYGGLAIGRLVLVEPTHRFGEHPMLLLYSMLCLALQIVFWRVRSVIADAIVVSCMGFLLGPHFAAGISVASKLLPREIHTSALGLIFVIGQAGGTFFPVITGTIATKAGVQVLQPILIGLIVAMGFSWAIVPKVGRRDE